MQLDLGDAISALCLFVAVLAAVAADRSANSSESSADSAIRANHLSQHNERLAMYKSLQRFHFELQIKGYDLPDKAMWEFSDAANISEFYFPQGVAEKMTAILEAANVFIATRIRWKDYNREIQSERDSAREALSSLQEQSPALRKMCKDCDEELRVFLRLEKKENPADS